MNLYLSENQFILFQTILPSLREREEIENITHNKILKI